MGYSEKTDMDLLPSSNMHLEGKNVQKLMKLHVKTKQFPWTWLEDVSKSCNY